MTTANGNVLGTTIVVNHGLPSQHWNFVVIGDGYRKNELMKYYYDVQNFADRLRDTKPFDALWNAVNIFRIDVSSTDSGADDPVACGGTGATSATYFDARFCNVGIRRALVVNNATAIQVANAMVPEWDVLLVLVNSLIYEGTGGGVAVSSTHPSASEIVVHEMGHTAFGLADEYESYAGCGSGESGHDVYTGPEPLEPSVTTKIDIGLLSGDTLSMHLHPCLQLLIVIVHSVIHSPAQFPLERLGFLKEHVIFIVQCTGQNTTAE